MTLHRSHTINVSIDRTPERAYAFVADPANLTRWATAFCLSVRESKGRWIIETPGGPMTIRFVEVNRFHVLDHYVGTIDGEETLNSMRVISNGSGSEVLFTLFQLPGVSDDRFAEDAGMVERDLQTLKRILETASA